MSKLEHIGGGRPGKQGHARALYNPLPARQHQPPPLSSHLPVGPHELAQLLQAGVALVNSGVAPPRRFQHAAGQARLGALLGGGNGRAREGSSYVARAWQAAAICGRRGTSFPAANRSSAAQRSAAWRDQTPVNQGRPHGWGAGCVLGGRGQLQQQLHLQLHGSQDVPLVLPGLLQLQRVEGSA